MRQDRKSERNNARRSFVTFGAHVEEEAIKFFGHLKEKKEKNLLRNTKVDLYKYINKRKGRAGSTS